MNAQGALLEQPSQHQQPAAEANQAGKKKRASSDLARALSCPVCAAAGIVNRPPVGKPIKQGSAAATASLRSSARQASSGPTENSEKWKAVPSLTYGQGQFLRRAFDYLSIERPGDGSDARLLALICLLRAARSGKANLVAQDVTGLRVADPHATLMALTGTGWLATTPEVVLAADPAKPAACTLPAFADPLNPWAIGKNARTRASGWTSRVLAHKLLRKKPNAVRITALYLTAHSDPDGTVEFAPDHLLSACALGEHATVVAAIKTLLEAGWLVACRPIGTGTVRCVLAESMLLLAPLAAPPAADPAAARQKADVEETAQAEQIDVPVSVQAAALIAGREAELAAWVEKFRKEHGHGPSWACLAVAHGWPRKFGRPRGVSSAALLSLHVNGWLAGLRTPYGMRPGPRYRALHQPDEPAKPVG